MYDGNSVHDRQRHVEQNNIGLIKQHLTGCTFPAVQDTYDTSQIVVVDELFKHVTYHGITVDNQKSSIHVFVPLFHPGRRSKWRIAVDRKIFFSVSYFYSKVNGFNF